MSELRPTLPGPRIEAEDILAPRLEAELALVGGVRNEPPATLTFVGSGMGVLAVGAAVAAAIATINAGFAQSNLLGIFDLAWTALGIGLLGAGLWRELRGLWGLRRVDRLRAGLASTDPAAVRDAATHWLRALPDGSALHPAIVQADAPTCLALLRAGPSAELRRAVDALSNTASLQILAAIAAVPSPMLDGLVVAWRGVRLVREVAALYGLRPGVFATAALLKRTLLSAALVTATDIAANTAAHALLSNKVLGHVVGDTAAAMVAARRMRLLARAAATACSPI